MATVAQARRIFLDALTLKYWGKSPNLEVDLPRANAALLRALAEAAWRKNAPKKLLEAHKP